MPSNPLTDDNWAQQVTEQITTFVGTVRDQTTNRAIKVTRAVVWGLFAGLVGTFLVVILLIGFTRLLQVLLSFLVSDARSVYLSYLLLGGILIAVSVVLMRYRKPRS